MHELQYLADLLRVRNATEQAITRIIRRPASIGHIGEFIASQIFSIQLEESATNRGHDGRFLSGVLRGKTVNVKMYGKREGSLDIKPSSLPEYYLVLTGPKASATNSKDQTRPWVISEVFLFDAPALVERLRIRGVRMGVATSVTLAEWDAARIYPPSEFAPLALTEGQMLAVRLFEGVG